MKKSIKVSQKSYLRVYYRLYALTKRMYDEGLIKPKDAIISYLFLSRAACEANGVKNKDDMAEEFSQAFYEIVKDFADEKGTEVEDILKGSAMFGANATIHANLLRQSKGRLKLPKKPEFYESLFLHMFHINDDDELLQKIVDDCEEAVDNLTDECF